MSLRVATFRALLLWLCAGSTALAYNPLVGDAAEQDLLGAVRAEKLIRAREKAEAILRRRPDSFIARYALVRVFHDEEANLPRALYHARQAERWLLQHHGNPPRGELARTWHRRLLRDQESLLSEMDRRTEQLELIDRHDAIYRPKMDFRRIWALMKLHRFAQATRLAKQVAASSDINRRVSGLNGLIAVEMERMRAEECYRVGLQAVEATGSQSCILLHNTAEAAFAVFRFGEVERLALKALQARWNDCPNSSYTHLAALYLLKADFQRAMGAVKSARDQGIRRRYRQQFEMENTSWLFRLLYALGKFDKAYELSQRMLRAPDRQGMTSTSVELRQFIAATEYHAALQARLISMQEHASARSVGQRLVSWVQRQRLRRLAWTARRRADRLLAGKVQLQDIVRPYFTPMAPWSAGALIPVAGEGVVLRALKTARARERGAFLERGVKHARGRARERSPSTPRTAKIAAAYFDALEAEVAYRSGEHETSFRLAQRALLGLPREEVLLRGHTQALAADAAWRLGRKGKAEELLHDVLKRFPTALRLLEIQLPARVAASADPLSRAVGRTLLRSPRLTPGELFVVRVVTRKETTEICLEGRRGVTYACARKEIPAKKKLSLEQQVEQVVDEFHAKVFSPKIDLTQQDINSLDGSAVRGDADVLLEKVLGK